jgi:hypothetical protein
MYDLRYDGFRFPQGGAPNFSSICGMKPVLKHSITLGLQPVLYGLQSEVEIFKNELLIQSSGSDSGELTGCSRIHPKGPL